MEWVKLCLRRYADFEGRSRRSEYWWFSLFRALVVGVPMLLAFTLMLLGGVGASTSNNGAYSGLVLLGFVLACLSGFISLALLVPGLAVSVRRLHDVGYSGWWWFIGLVPFGGLALFVFTVLDSAPGMNQWGPNPKGIMGHPGAYGYPVGYGQPGAYGLDSGYPPGPYGSSHSDVDLYAQPPHGNQPGPPPSQYGNPYGQG